MGGGLKYFGVVGGGVNGVVIRVVTRFALVFGVDSDISRAIGCKKKVLLLKCAIFITQWINASK